MRRVTTWLVITILLVVLLRGDAEASHYVWLIHDGGKQSSSWSGPENYLSYWMRNNTSTWIWAEASVDPYMTQAVNNWSAAVPQVKYYKTSSSASADVIFRNLPCSMPNAVGCYGLLDIFSDSTRGANYVYKAEIKVNLSKLGSETARINTAAHEWGHYIGLHERYRESDGSCTYENSVMDASGCNSLTGPSSLDVSRVREFLGTGSESQPSYNVSGTKATIRWYDKSALELYYVVEYFRYTDNYKVHESRVSQNTGLIAGLSWISDRVIQDVFDRAALGLPAGSYYACVKPYIDPWGTYGTRMCTTAFYIPVS